MLASRLMVLNETVDHLYTLSEILLDEVDERAVASHQLRAQRRRCKEALQTMRVLIPKLEAVRNTSVVTIDQPRVS